MHKLGKRDPMKKKNNPRPINTHRNETYDHSPSVNCVLDNSLTCERKTGKQLPKSLKSFLSFSFFLSPCIGKWPC